MLKLRNWFYLRLWPTFKFVLRIGRHERLIYTRTRGWRRVGLE
jgi:hypothetical protein